ncbi:MAG TPA: hypothetical protein DCY13_03155 [Verrucomicrobiales bacterium]|nr:hypothetical protein [Verrucomicrobiales bacterium]
MPFRPILLALLSGAMVLCANEAADRHFVEKVKPLLDSRCVSCHGPDKVKGGLRLDSRPALLQGGDTGPALVPGKPADSLMLQAVMHAKKDLEMPPKEKLTPQDIEVLERWIRDGAPWPDGTAAEALTIHVEPGERIGDAWSDPRNPIVRIFGGQRLDLWSLKPIERPPVPALKGTAHGQTSRHPVDRFIRARLAEHGLSPAPETDKRTLARRLAFDLTGLPPSPEMLAAFLDDDSPDAYERLVDRLLASPAYGEHQARQWLDVVRYSDSNGFDWDEYRKQAWRFRDYVIRSFNADKPFDEFIREQLAGDELVPGAPRDEIDRDRLIATGFLRIGPQDNSASLFNEQDRARSEWMADLTETTGSAFLGLTLSCCRCHDHKYDPLSQADHFRLRAFFEPLKHADDLPLDLKPDQERIRTHNDRIADELKPLEKEREKLLESIRNRLRTERRQQLPADELALLQLPEGERNDEQKQAIKKIQAKLKPTDEEVTEGATNEEKARRKELADAIKELEGKRLAFTVGLLATDKTNDVALTRILFQGNHKDPREPVPPGFLSALDPNPAPLADPPNPGTTGRRLTLANWIAADSNPLTARVWVNRVWQGHFGRGLVPTANDFGLAGERPTHPELLDWLTSEFMAQGWSVKQLHKLIVTSATYRQSSAPRNEAAMATDPDNTLYWRQNLRRLTAEQLRDALLQVSGQLTGKAGGEPVWPELPAEVLQANPAFLDDNAEKTKGWYPSPEAEQGARSVYLVQKRTVRVPFLEAFDLPSNELSCARRQESIVAPQAFSLLNSDLAARCARAFAGRIAAEGDEAIEKAFALSLQRAPTDSELAACRKLSQEHGLAAVCRALLNVNEFLYVD